MSGLPRLRAIADTLLDETVSLEALCRAADDLFALCSEISPHGASGDSDLALPSGTALSPSSAAACTRDGRRTALFVRGLHDAIKATQATEIVYAGTGPFAPLALPLMTIFSPSQVRFTLIDIHQSSIDSVNALLRHFDFEGSAIACDATTYRHDGPPFDVLVAEVMQRAIGVEGQVEICRNLAKYLKPGGVMVPENVEVNLAFDQSSTVGVVAELSAATLAMTPDRENRLDVRTLAMPTVPPRAQAMYVTALRTFGRHVLGPLESGLTHPEMVWDLSDIQPGERVRFWYQLGARPGIRWEKCDPQDG